MPDLDDSAPETGAEEAEVSAASVNDEAVEAEADAAETKSAEAEPVAAEPAVPPVTDEVLLASVDVARDALLEITPAATVGAVVGHVAEADHVLSLMFESTMPGYPGWHWTVTMSRIDDQSEPSVLETELMPGERALLAPDWVPWSERLAEYQASQEALAAEAAALAGIDDEESDDDSDDEDLDEDDLDGDDDLDDEDDDEEEDDDDHDAPVLHSGDIDGVDIDDDLDDAEDDDVAFEFDEDGSATLLDAEVGEADEAEPEADDDSPEPPAVAGSGELLGEDEH